MEKNTKENLSVFKKDDVVECVDDGGSNRIKNGKRYVVEYGTKDYVKLMGIDTVYFDIRFQLVSPTPKSLLKDGMRVKFRGGHIGIYLNGYVVEHEKVLTNLINYNESLIYNNGRFKKWDVVSIYNLPDWGRDYLIPSKYGSLVWKREEQPVKTEAQKKLEELEATIKEASKQMQELKAEMEEQ